MLRNRGSWESKYINRCLIIHSKPKKENQDWKFCYLVHWYITTGKRTFVDFLLVISLARAVHCTVSVSGWCVLNSKWPRFPVYQRVLFLCQRQVSFCSADLVLCFVIQLSPFQNGRYSFPSIPLFSLVLSSLKRLSVFPIKNSLQLYI